MGFDTGKTPLCKVRDMIFGLEQTEFLALAAAYLEVKLRLLSGEG